MKVRYCFPIFFLLPLLLKGEDQGLPQRSQELMEKLSNWELDRQAEVQSQIKERRKQVVEALKGHLAIASRDGDLDGILAIQKRIEALSGIESGSIAKMPSKESGLDVTDTVWKADRGPNEGRIIQFHSEGSMMIVEPNGKKWESWEWRQVESGSLEIRSSKPGSTFQKVRFSNSGADFTWSRDENSEPSQYRRETNDSGSSSDDSNDTPSPGIFRGL